MNKKYGSATGDTLGLLEQPRAPASFSQAKLKAARCVGCGLMSVFFSDLLESNTKCVSGVCCRRMVVSKIIDL